MPSPGDLVFMKSFSERSLEFSIGKDEDEECNNPFKVAVENKQLKIGSRSLASSEKLKNCLRVTSEKLKSYKKLSENETENSETCSHGIEIMKLSKRIEELEEER